MDMDEKILSVSVAAYNVERTLREALQPFVECDCADGLDVMIIDDGSTDTTAAIGKEYAEKYPQTFRLISKPNGGWGSTLNTGFAQAKGRYFKQLDGDDYFSAENLPHFLDFLRQTDADLVYTPYVYFSDDGGKMLRESPHDGWKSYFKDHRTWKIEECPKLMPAMHSLTVRTDLLRANNIQILEHCFYTDIEFMLKAYNCAQTIAFYELPIYYYRVGRSGQSMSMEGVRKHYGDHLKMLRRMLAYAHSSVTTPVKKKIFRIRLGGCCNMQYVFYFALPHTREHKNELLAFDRMLKEDYPDYYAVPQGNIITAGRAVRFTPYGLFAWAKMSKDRRKKENLFENLL